ncbi:MAG: NADH-quinone oxidoreductase subunit C [Bacteroidales bacterium]|nr:NADH-quinone oxidoreductase subunit D [Bacteroidales bacterium]MCD8393573.1 NADH-quinone oxidoreductase subunit C [Bacteroidales bacterium]
MSTLQDKIAKLFPQATFEDGEFLLVNIPDAQWHDLAKTLRDDEDLAFDYLVTIVGMDWTDRLGCVYYLTSTKHARHISVRVATEDRDNPMLHSIADLWHIAGIYEREVYDFFGIIFLNNPDMRRLFLSIDWKGYPLRKDYDEDPALNPVSTENERQDDNTYSWVETPDGKVEKKTIPVFGEDDFVVNIGPQHPATHGVLRFRTSVDGETIKKIDVYMGYIHRGVEKLCESLTYPQTLHYMDRLDYFSAHNYHHGLCMCIEKAANIKVPRRAQVIRVMMDELSRIASHCLFIGTYCMDLGATTMLFYTLRVREMILDIMEKTCGARMTFNYDCIGGVMQDLAPDFQQDVKHLLEVLPANIKEYNKLFTGNVIAKNRLEHVGYLSREDAISWAVTGPSGRASGWACDVRKTDPYSIYPELEFDEVTRTEGDSMARFKVRLDEMVQSARILEQLVDNIPQGDICAKVPKVLKLPVGHWFQLVEGCRGAFGIYIESTGTASPMRLKIVPPCLPLAAVVDHITRGGKIADLITIGGSLDYIVPDMDR